VRLRRTLALPHVGAHGRCPAQLAHRFAPGIPAGLGFGPVFAGLGGPALTVNDTVGGWSAGRVTLEIAPAYRGPVLVRGHQLDGPRPLAFATRGVSAAPFSELQIPPAPRGSVGWRREAIELEFAAAGCYGLQVDGDRFSEVIVVQAP
jgi:hypothetical protein